MQDGDLSNGAVARLTVILEGCLATIDTSTTGRIRKVTTIDIDWLETPLKSIQDMKRRYPDIAIDVITFISDEVAERAAQFFDRTGIAFNTVEYHNFKEWTWALRFRYDIVTVYDSDPDRLHMYGQKGVSITKGFVF